MPRARGSTALACTCTDRRSIIAEIKRVIGHGLSERQCSHVAFRAAKHVGGACTIQCAIAWYIADVERLRSVKKLAMHLRYLLNARDRS